MVILRLTISRQTQFSSTPFRSLLSNGESQKQQRAELLRQVETRGDVLWGNKVLGHLDAVVQVTDLWDVINKSETMFYAS